MGTVYILGAGASHFACFPLAGGLWQFLQRELDQTKNEVIKRHGSQCRALVERVSEFIQKDKPPLCPPDLEMIFTLIDLVEIQGGVLGSLDFRGFDLYAARYGFASLVTDAFQGHSSDVQKWLEDKSRVAQAWAGTVNRGDTIISFNWDLLHEMILFKKGKWNYQDGYGFPAQRQTQGQGSPILILKLHGSCNWALQHPDDPSPSVDYIAQFFEFADPNGNFTSTSDHGESLILPSYLKDPSQKPSLHTVWKQAYNALREATEVIVLGYSLPLADVPTRTVMSLALRQNMTLDVINVALGDPLTAGDAYRRWSDFCGHLAKRINPIYKTFEAFVLG